MIAASPHTDQAAVNVSTDLSKDLSTHLVTAVHYATPTHRRAASDRW